MIAIVIETEEIIGSNFHDNGHWRTEADYDVIRYTGVFINFENENITLC